MRSTARACTRRWLRGVCRGTTPGQLNLNLPHTNLFFLPLAFLSPRQGLVVWAIASLLVFAWSTWASLRALRWRLPLVGWIALVVYLLAWGPAAAFSLTLQLSFLLDGPGDRFLARGA